MRCQCCIQSVVVPLEPILEPMGTQKDASPNSPKFVSAYYIKKLNAIIVFRNFLISNTSDKTSLNVFSIFVPNKLVTFINERDRPWMIKKNIKPH